MWFARVIAFLLHLILAKGELKGMAKHATFGFLSPCFIPGLQKNKTIIWNCSFLLPPKSNNQNALFQSAFSQPGPMDKMSRAMQPVSGVSRKLSMGGISQESRLFLLGENGKELVWGSCWGKEWSRTTLTGIAVERWMGWVESLHLLTVDSSGKWLGTLTGRTL